MRVLVVVERGLAEAVRQVLERDGHFLTLTHSGNQVLQVAKALTFDAVVVDTALTLDGFKITRQLREAGIRAPILMLIAKELVREVVKVTAAGADDFLVKPFTLSEFAARLGTLFVRGPARDPVRLQVIDLVLDKTSHEVWRNDKPVRLTRKEFQLLELLLRSSGRVIHRDELIEALWLAKGNVESNTLDAFIRLLRRKIDQGHAVKLIHTVRGIGYRLGP